MDSEERVRVVLEGGIPDRVPVHDGYWGETLIRWGSEGLPAEAVKDEDARGEFFGTEIRMIRIDDTYRYQEKLIEEDERYRVRLNRKGMVERVIKGKTTTPGVISFPAPGKDAWRELKPRLQTMEGRLRPDLGARYRDYRRNGRFVVATIHDPFESSWSKIGTTFLLESMKSDPDFIREVFQTVTDLNLGVCEELLGQGYRIDGGWVWGDIAYSSGLLFSPRMYRDLLYPFHRRIFDFFTSRGLPVIYHSDGDLREALPFLVEAGVRCIQPLETKAGMDLAELKRDYGDRLVLMGGVDFDRISRHPEEAESEIRSKMVPAMQGGGYIYHSDHSIPPGVSLSTYLSALETVREAGTYR
jgi:uroporphyrinogen decarboxylase